MIQTEWPFTLPQGLEDGGTLHREGVMRMATAGDEIIPWGDSRVQSNEAYHTIILFSRVITRLGGLKSINPNVIERMPVPDMNFLLELYNRIHGTGKALISAACPKCGHTFNVEMTSAGGSAATP